MYKIDSIPDIPVFTSKLTPEECVILKSLTGDKIIKLFLDHGEYVEKWWNEKTGERDGEVDGETTFVLF